MLFTSLSFYKILCCNRDIFTLTGMGDRLSRLPRLLPFSVFARVRRACLSCSLPSHDRMSRAWSCIDGQEKSIILLIGNNLICSKSQTNKNNTKFLVVYRWDWHQGHSLILLLTAGKNSHTWKSLNVQGISKLFREHVQLCGWNNVIFLWSCKTSVKCSQGHYQKVQFFLQQLESRYLCHTVYSLQSVNMVCIQIENLRTPIQECWGVSWTWPMSWGTYQGERSSSCTKCVSWNAWNLCNRTYYNTEIAMQVLLVLSM